MPPPRSHGPPLPFSLPPRSRFLPSIGSCSRRAVTSAATSSPPPSPAGCRRPLRYAVLGAGFAGLSVAWHLLKVRSSFYVLAFFHCQRQHRLKPTDVVCLQHSPKDSRVSVDVYDENGVGGGASGVSGGLLHPYSPKGLLHHCPCNHFNTSVTQFCSNYVSSISLVHT
jgi:hypothetical protein